MRKIGVNQIFVLAIGSFIVLSLIWLLLILNSADPDAVQLKAKEYFEQIVNNGLEEENIKLLSAFDYNDGYITVLTAKFYTAGTQVYCHFYENSRRLIVDASREISMFTDTTARCPNHVNSSFVALSYSFKKSPRFVPVPIKRRQFFEQKHDLVVCVELELQPNWLQITSFIEYHKSLNFDYFHFTTINLDAYTRKILDDYIRLGTVQLTSMRNYRNLTNTEHINDFNSIQRTNCLLHARLDSNLVTFLRMDERVAEIPFFLDSLKNENSLETRVVTTTVQREEILKKFTNESHLEASMRHWSYKKNVQFRKVIDPKRIENLGQISEDFVYKKASTYFPIVSDSVTSSIMARSKYNYDSRPIYCDEFDIGVLSWCPVNVYHCQFRDKENEKKVMRKREEARKIKYKQQTIRW